MLKNNTYFNHSILLTCTALSAHATLAADTEKPFLRHEIELSSPSIFGGSSISKPGLFLQGGYHHRLSERFQLSSELRLAIQKNIYLAMLVGPTYNFADEQGSIANAFFVSTLFGFESVPLLNYRDTNAIGELVVGKRFAISDTVSWKPSASILYSPGSEAEISYKVTPLSLSLSF